MLERIGHIKNPLTVIAMFAAIAEVSGTVVLPLVADNAQAIYVWFLMFFPCFLVLLFFVTLWTDHSVLYAPSDYKDDQSFINARFKHLPNDSFYEFMNEVEKHAIDEPQTLDSTSDNSSSTDNQEETAPPSKTGASIDDKFQIDISEAARTFNDALLLNINKNRVIRSLAQRFNGTFKENIVPKDFPNIEFGAVIESKDALCVVDFVDANGDRHTIKSEVKKAIESAVILWETLTAMEKSKFTFHLAYMVQTEVNSIEPEEMALYAGDLKRLPFQANAFLYRYSKRQLETALII